MSRTARHRPDADGRVLDAHLLDAHLLDARRPRRLWRGGMALLGASLVAFGLLPTPMVSAHATLEASIPAPSSVLESAPVNVVLDFDEPIEAGLSSIEVFDASAGSIDVGAPQRAPGDDSVVLASLPDLVDGVYAVVWRVASSDGHVVDGAFSFSVGTGSGEVGDLLDRVTGDARASSAVTRSGDVARLVLYLGLVLLLGAGSWTLLTGGDVPGFRRRLPVIGWAMAFVASAALYGLYGATAVAGSMSDVFSPEVWGRIDGSQTGRMILLRLALLVALGVLLVLRSSRAAGWWRYGALLAGLGSLITLPAAGHPTGASPRALYVALDMVHLTAIVGWMGGLALFALGGRAWLEDERATAAVRTFSRTATVLVPVIVVTGVLQAVELAGGVDAITETDWGRTLLVKLSVVSVLVAIGAVSRWLVQQVGTTAVRRTVIAEAVLGVVVLAATASLVTLPPEPPAASQVFTSTLSQAGLIVDITVTPGRVGTNEMHLVITPAGGSIQPVSSIEARMSLPAREVPASPVSLVADGPNHSTGTITLPFAGDWTLDMIIEVSPGNTTLLSTVVPIP